MITTIVNETKQINFLEIYISSIFYYPFAALYSIRCNEYKLWMFVVSYTYIWKLWVPFSQFLSSCEYGETVTTKIDTSIRRNWILNWSKSCCFWISTDKDHKQFWAKFYYLRTHNTFGCTLHYSTENVMCIRWMCINAMRAFWNMYIHCAMHKTCICMHE